MPTLRSHAAFLCLIPFAFLACSAEDPRSTEELVTAAAQGDQGAMTELENRVREKVQEGAEVAENLSDDDLATSALFSIDPQDLVNLAEKGNSQACFLLGQRLMAEQDESGKDWMMKAVDADNSDAIYFVGKAKFHGSGGFTIDAEAGRALLEKSAANGLAQAAFDLGVAYRYGIDVETDRDVAIQWYEQAEQGGYVAAKDELRQMSEE